MNKLIISTATAVFAILLLYNGSLHAQTEKGRFVIGAGSTLSFISGNSTWGYKGEDNIGKETFSKFNIHPFAGYFVMDNLNVAVALSYTSSKNTVTPTGEDKTENKTSEFYIGPAVTYYIPVTEKLKAYAIVGGGSALANTGNGDDNSYNGFYFYGAPGLSYFIGRNVALEFQLNYEKYHYSNKAESDYKWKSQQFAPVLGFSVFL